MARLQSMSDAPPAVRTLK